MELKTEPVMKIKEIFGPTIEGEGSFSGWPCWFVRLSNCNIWSGDPKTKHRTACPYCDTDFVGGVDMSVDEILSKLMTLPPEEIPLVNITGGEPLLQDLGPLCRELASVGYWVNIETNGTLELNWKKPGGVYITCSPKVPRRSMSLSPENIDFIKILYPHPSGKIPPEDFNEMDCEKYIQPIEYDGVSNYEECVKKVYDLAGSGWRLSVQIQKVIGVD